MKLLDFFKKRERRKKLARASTEASRLESGESAASQAPAGIKIGESKRAAVILQSPHVTEKSSLASESGVYVFRVASGASKYEIKKSVEELYKVKVDKIRVISVPSRARRVGRKLGSRPGYRKALVKLYTGYKIEYI